MLKFKEKPSIAGLGKTLLAVIFFSVGGSLAHAGNDPGRASADWLDMHADAHFGQKCSVKVTSVRFESKTGNGLSYFMAWTRDGNSGGRILAAVPTARENSFLSYYGAVATWEGSEPKTRRLIGTLKRTSRGQLVLVADDALALFDSPPPPPSSAPRQESEPFRTWTHIDGRTLTARMISATTTTVTLLRAEDQRQFTIPQSALSEPDRAYVAHRQKGR